MATLALLGAAVLLGLAGSWHCAAMCGAPCAAARSGGGAPAAAAFHIGRGVGYAAAGAVVAASVSGFAFWAALSPALRPFWALLNAAALVLGLCLMLRGRQPAWLARLGRPPTAATAPWQVVRVPARAAAIGSLWFAWPCGLLQSALVIAALTGDAAGGALAMFGFALASAPGLVIGPWLWRRLASPAGAVAGAALAVRGAGLLLAGASAWAITQQLAPGFAAYCRSL